MKACPRCQLEKDPAEFYQRGRGGLSSYCRGCYKELGAERYRADPERTQAQSSAWAKAHRPEVNADRHRTRRADPAYRAAERALERVRDRERHPDRWIRDNYKMTREQWDQMLADQGGCAICGATEPRGAGRFHVDHDHNCCPGKKSCGKCVRGLLCNGCNPMLGYVNDDPAILRRAIEYLEKAR